MSVDSREHFAEFGEGCVIQPGATVGLRYKDGCEPVVLGDHVTIRSGSVIYADVSVGEDCQTGHNVMIREKTSIGSHVVVGTNTVIDGHVDIGDFVKIESACYIPTHVTIGSRVFFGPGVVLTNDRYPLRDRDNYRPEGPVIRGRSDDRSGRRRFAGGPDRCGRLHRRGGGCHQGRGAWNARQGRAREALPPARQAEGEQHSALVAPVSPGPVSPLTVGIIGCGKQAPKHLRGFQADREVEVVLGDIDEARARALAESAGVRWAPVDEIFSDARVAAVDLCTPTTTHAGLIERAVLTGKAFLCEKPLCQTLAEAERIGRAVLDHEAIGMVGFVYRLVPAFEVGAEVMKGVAETGTSGVLGRVLSATFRIGGRGSHRLWKHRRETGGGAINEMLVHMLDLALWYFEMPAKS